MSTDIETRLRAAFLAAEQVIADDHDTPEFLAQPTRLPRRRAALWALVAAAAVVVAVAALAISLRSDHSSTPPSHLGTTVATPTPTSGPVVNAGPQAKSCDVALPRTWRRVLAAGHVPGDHLDLRAVDPAGNSYAAQTLGTTSQLVLITPARSVQVLYRAPAGSRIGDVVVDGHWLAASLYSGGAPGANTGGSAEGIVGVDLNTDTVRTVRPSTPDTTLIIEPPVVVGHTVYWAESTSAPNTGTVYAFDLTTRTRRTLDHGDVLDPATFGGGVYWQKGAKVVTYVAGELPRGFSPVPGKAYGRLHRSGDVYAWSETVDANLVITMVRRGEAPTTVLRPQDSDQNLVAAGLSGDYLLYGDGRHVRVLDWTTGGSTTLPGADIVGRALAGGSTIAFETADGSLSVVRAANLPHLTC